MINTFIIVAILVNSYRSILVIVLKSNKSYLYIMRVYMMNEITFSASDFDIFLREFDTHDNITKY